MSGLAGCQILECGVDWMTATCRHGNEGNALAIIAQEWLIDRSTEGYETARWNWNSYIGSQTDGISYGRRDDGVIVRLSGSMAVRHWEVLRYWAHHVSRLDLQLTILSPRPHENHARVNWNRLQLDGRVESGMTRTKYTESTPDGATCNIGSRSSDRYFRIYDKWSESDHEYEEGSWRYEIEYKAERAEKLSHRLLGSRRQVDAIYDAIVTAYDSYHITVPADQPAWDYRDTVTPHATDDQRRLTWLKRCIKPLVARLSEAYGNVTVFNALGIYLIEDEATEVVDLFTEVDLPTERA